ncbi:uncharacterized protein EAF01_004830 [Botrytis porri]|uniref:uncharacterized protein n=1 Tax=Botrytis porri TaxID=87229 RepID=UPI0019003A97|nr:uncharacterized protein EAF01_004830 [Botrytis porri]KAF7907243.1 hypothetical protein EAF01_004830 [Botrytis porri]
MAMNGVRDDANRDGILPQLIDFIRHLGKPGKFGSPYPQSVVSREKKAENLPVAGLSIMSERKLAITIIYENAYEWTRRYKEHATQELTLAFENGLGKPLLVIGEARVIMCVMSVAIASSLNGVGGPVTYVLDSVRFLPCAIKTRDLCYVRDRDQWEQAQQVLGEIRSIT